MSEIYNDKKWLSFQAILHGLKDRGDSLSEQGTLFELFCKKILETSPFFTDDVRKVWTWKEFPGNGGMHDTGIDLVVLDKQGNYWAIQCKFYDYDTKVSKADIDSFISASVREFTIDGVQHSFSQRYVFSTTEDISLNASNLFTTIGPNMLLECGIDWEHFDLDDVETMMVCEKKTPRPHQVEAINDVLSGFKEHDRGRLIMACGTGKTFTSLKIVEGLYNSKKTAVGSSLNEPFNVLYLVPSIALLSQTIVEWKTQQEFNTTVRTFGVCSDETAGKDKSKKRKKDQDELLVQMPIPATTDVAKIGKEYQKNKHCINIFFSTYQSIDVVSAVAKQNGIIFDIAVCDEAHRTIGAFKQGDTDDETNFVKIHKDSNVPCHKRLYMTATPKVYSANAKQEASEGGYEVYSMDDENIYGPIFHYLSFGQAITKQLLTDYRLLVLNIRKSDIARLRLPDYVFGNLDDASRIVGSLSALSKIPSDFSPDEFKLDPTPMKRAVAFCSTIAQADAIAKSYNHLADDKCLGKEYMESQGFIIPKAQLITGQDNTKEKNKKLDWLRGDIEDGTCHILTNARCLSEGVDVPSLDSVIFMAKKRSQVDIIQAVGRVMRKFGGGAEKRYGYIVIPVVISDEKMTDKTLSNNEEFKVVWQVVQALRSHDERLDTEINKIGVTGKLPGNICFINTFVPPVSKMGVSVGSRNKEIQEGVDTDESIHNDVDDFNASLPTDEELKQNELLFCAQLVKHCGNRLYWEDWSKNIGDVTNNLSLKIKNQIDTDERTSKAFERFLKEFRKLLNPNVSETEGINMLAEHIVTLPVLKTIFNDNDLIDQNPVTQIMETMVKKLKGLDAEIKSLDDFYESVRKTVKGVTSSEGRQEIIRKLFEKFFQYALPASAEKFGIVYTPVEIVDFIVNSVAQVLKDEFGQSITSPGIKILDPFTGTGTFIVRLLDKLKELGISNEDLKTKYQNDIWCNEIMLLSYYIALVNIEDTFGRLGNQGFLPFDHAVLTDTFQMAEKRNKKFYQSVLFEDQEFAQANSKAKEEDESNIRIIIANPPYSVGQHSANDNNANDKYPSLDNRISQTYALNVKAKHLTALYDSYVRSFRWASDRIGDDGIISFVSNGSYVDNLAFSGFRRDLLKEFNHVYVFNLRGNQRTQGELSRKEGGKIFGSGSRNTICIIVLVKHKGQPLDDYVHYHDIGDYLSREEKLKIVRNFHDISRIKWENIAPDKNNDWINKRDESYEKLIPAGIKGNNNKNTLSLFGECYSSGIKTNRDAWVISFNKQVLLENMKRFAKTFNENQVRVLLLLKGKNGNTDKIKFITQNVIYAPKDIKWGDEIFRLLSLGKPLDIDTNFVKTIMYRPFVKKRIYLDKKVLNSVYSWKSIPVQYDLFPLICMSMPPLKKQFSTIVTDTYLDIDCFEHSLAFPYEWETKNENISQTLFDVDQCAISDLSLSAFQNAYLDSSITKHDIFCYFYAVLHSTEFKMKYLNNLSKDPLRVPLLSHFHDYKKIGSELINLHLNYESAPAYKGMIVKIKEEDYRVSKIRFLSKERKDTIIFNDKITISNIPLEAYNYVVNGRPAIEWVLDQYQYSVDSESGIVDDPNLYDENKGGKYVFDLLLSLITVSLETLKLISLLPKYEEI